MLEELTDVIPVNTQCQYLSVELQIGTNARGQIGCSKRHLSFSSL